MIDHILKRALTREEGGGRLYSLHACPDLDELAAFLDGLLDKERHKYIADHIIHCDACFKTIAEAEAASSKIDKARRPPEAMEEKAKMVAKSSSKSRAIQIFWKNKFLYLFLLFLLLSFVFERYFAQFLVVSVVFGFKWVMDTGGTRALIMIYDTWRRHRSESGSDDKESLFRR